MTESRVSVFMVNSSTTKSHCETTLELSVCLVSAKKLKYLQCSTFFSWVTFIVFPASGWPHPSTLICLFFLLVLRLFVTLIHPSNFSGPPCLSVYVRHLPKVSTMSSKIVPASVAFLKDSSGILFFIPHIVLAQYVR